LHNTGLSLLMWINRTQ